LSIFPPHFEPAGRGNHHADPGYPGETSNGNQELLVHHTPSEGCYQNHPSSRFLWIGFSACRAQLVTWSPEQAVAPAYLADYVSREGRTSISQATILRFFSSYLSVLITPPWAITSNCFTINTYKKRP
jgi:hypothetical protein